VHYTVRVAPDLHIYCLDVETRPPGYVLGGWSRVRLADSYASK